MAFVSLAWPRVRSQPSHRIIPLSLALPAAAAAVSAAALAVTALVLWSADRNAAPRVTQDTGGTAGTVGEAAGATPGANARAELTRQFDAARARHEAGERVEAFAALTLLADQGHCDSARLALQLIQAGPEAYLTTFAASPTQIARWRAMPGCWPSARGR